MFSILKTSFLKKIKLQWVLHDAKKMVTGEGHVVKNMLNIKAYWGTGQQQKTE